MKSALALLALLAASCASGDRVEAGPEPTEVKDRADLERYAGAYISIEGRFGHVEAQHGTVTLRSGLVIYLPHFDLYKQGDDWLKYVGHTVRVEGILHTYSTGVSGAPGPFIDVRSFEQADQSE
jgi:hypothetical protein